MENHNKNMKDHLHLIEQIESLKQSLYTMRLTNDITPIGQYAMEMGFNALIDVVKNLSPNTVLVDSLPSRKCSDCGTEFKSQGRCPECNPMG